MFQGGCMCKYSISAICFAVFSLSFGFSAEGSEAEIKLKIQKLSESCNSTPFKGVPKTTEQMFCSGGFNELVVRHCIRANLNTDQYDESISISHSYLDENNNEAKIKVTMKCSGVET